MDTMLPELFFATEAWATPALVLARIAGIVALLPSVGDRKLGFAVRVVMCVALTAIAAPVCTSYAPLASRAAGPSAAAFLPSVFQELGLGLVLGAGLQMLLLGVQVAGQLVSQMSGISLAGIYDAAGERTSPVTLLLDMLALAVFLVLGGQRLVIGGLLNTFRDWPPGSTAISATTADVLGELITMSFMLGIQAALPILATLFVSNVLVGMLGRLMPQMNVLLMSSGLNPLLLLASLMVGLGAMAWTLQSHLEPFVGQVVKLCGG